MAYTAISDVIVPEVYNPYMIAKTVELNKFISSGIATRDPDLQFPNVARKVRGGKTIHIPFWKSLVDADDNDDEILSDSDALTVNNIEAGESIAAIHLRGKAWGSNDLAGYFAGDDPMAAIANMAGAYWANKIQKVAIQTLEGLTGSSGVLASHVNDITSETSTAISTEAMIDTMYLMGDHVSELAGIACCSAVMAALVKLDLIETVRDSENNIELNYYMGKPVIVDDSLDGTSGAYPVYFFGRGAFAFNEDTTGLELTETDRDKLGGNDVLITRRAFVMHPRGVSWTGTAAGTTPTNTELATVGNWTLADNIKNVPITKLVATLA